MRTVRPLRRRSKSDVAGRLVDALSSCLPSVSSSPALTKKHLRPSDGSQLTLSVARSAEMLALNWRVARSLDLEQITAWQREVEVMHRQSSCTNTVSLFYFGCVAQWWNVESSPGNFPCPELHLHLTCDHLVGKPSAVAQPTRPSYLSSFRGP